MNNLKNLYSKRDEVFADRTYEIFEKIDTTLSCVTVFLTDIDDLVAQGVIAWEDTSLVDDFVIVIGTVQYNLDDVLTIGDKKIKLTLDNLTQFERVVHMSIPYNLVLENDKDNIIEYLYSIGADLDNDFSTMQIPVVNTDFDLTELSDEQRQSLMSNPTTKHDN